MRYCVGIGFEDTDATIITLLPSDTLLMNLKFAVTAKELQQSRIGFILCFHCMDIDLLHHISRSLLFLYEHSFFSAHEPEGPISLDTKKNDSIRFRCEQSVKNLSHRPEFQKNAITQPTAIALAMLMKREHLSVELATALSYPSARWERRSVVFL